MLLLLLLSLFGRPFLQAVITTRILQLVHELCRKRIHVTKRDLFYTGGWRLGAAQLGSSGMECVWWQTWRRHEAAAGAAPRRAWTTAVTTGPTLQLVHMPSRSASWLVQT